MTFIWHINKTNKEHMNDRIRHLMKI